LLRQRKIIQAIEPDEDPFSTLSVQMAAANKAPRGDSELRLSRSKERNRMKAIFLCAMLLGCGLLFPLASAQSDPATFPLAGDWDGVFVFQGSVHHLVLHMNTTPEGKMTALLDTKDLWRSRNRWFVRRQASDPSILLLEAGRRKARGR
jgi:hypothetical protein